MDYILHCLVWKGMVIDMDKLLSMGALPQTGDPMGGMLGIFAIGMGVALVVIIVMVVLMRRNR